MTLISLNSTQAIDVYDKNNDTLFQISPQPQYRHERSLGFDDSGKNLAVLVVWSKVQNVGNQTILQIVHPQPEQKPIWEPW